MFHIICSCAYFVVAVTSFTYMFVCVKLTSKPASSASFALRSLSTINLVRRTSAQCSKTVSWWAASVARACCFALPSRGFSPPPSFGGTIFAVHAHVSCMFCIGANWRAIRLWRFSYPFWLASNRSTERRIWPDDFPKKIFPGGPYFKTADELYRVPQKFQPARGGEAWRRNVWRPVYIRPSLRLSLILGCVQALSKNLPNLHGPSHVAAPPPAPAAYFNEI